MFARTERCIHDLKKLFVTQRLPREKKTSIYTYRMKLHGMNVRPGRHFEVVWIWKWIFFYYSKAPECFHIFLHNSKIRNFYYDMRPIELESDNRDWQIYNIHFAYKYTVWQMALLIKTKSWVSCDLWIWANATNMFADVLNKNKYTTI